MYCVEPSAILKHKDLWKSLAWDSWDRQNLCHFPTPSSMMCKNLGQHRQYYAPLFYVLIDGSLLGTIHSAIIFLFYYIVGGFCVIWALFKIKLNFSFFFGQRWWYFSGMIHSSNTPTIYDVMLCYTIPKQLKIQHAQSILEYSKLKIWNNSNLVLHGLTRFSIIWF